MCSDATAPPATLLARLLPPPASALLPPDFLQSAHFTRMQVSCEKGLGCQNSRFYCVLISMMNIGRGVSVSVPLIRVAGVPPVAVDKLLPRRIRK